MDEVRMVLRQNPWNGVPSLEVQGVGLRPAEREALEKEIGRLFEKLIHKGSGAEVELKTRVSAAGWPGRFRVTLGEEGGRCPTLLFESVVSAAPPPASPVPAWQTAFAAEIKAVFGDEKLNGLTQSERLVVRFVVDEVCELATKRPAELAPLLLAAYIGLGERLCVAEDAEKVGLYVLAGRGLERLLPALLPRGAEPSASEPAAAARPYAVRLRSAAHLLGRFLGIDTPSVDS